jgi:hypothetical protein
MERDVTPQEAVEEVMDAPTTAAPETRYGEPPTAPDDERGKPDSPGRSDEAQDPDREGGVGPPDKPAQDLPDTTPEVEPLPGDETADSEEAR